MSSNSAKTSLHIPVMLSQIHQFLDPCFQRQSSGEIRYFDGTFGRGGHLGSLLLRHPKLQAVAFDRDPQAIAYAKGHFAAEIEQGRLQLEQKNYSQFSPQEGFFDGMLIDLGVSSPQLDQAERGFSFYHQGPLDMRMDLRQDLTAAQILNTWEEEDLLEMFRTLGEVPKPYRVVQEVLRIRQQKALATTTELAQLIERTDGWQKKGHHPATQYFMGLRLAVNAELPSLELALRPLLLGLKPRGRLAVLTFHSLEDRIVKNVFKTASDLGAPLLKNVLAPEPDELKMNPRSRSAKLRVFEREDPSLQSEPPRPGMKPRRQKRWRPDEDGSQ